MESITLGRPGIGPAPRTPSAPRLFAALWVPTILLLTAVFYLYVDQEVRSGRAILALAQSHELAIGKNEVEAELERVTDETGIMAEHSEFVLRNALNRASALSELNHGFLSLSRISGRYDQIRLLDRAGQEILRVNGYGGSQKTVPEARLQNKGKRYYFLDTIALDKGQFYVSPLDLNIEHGKIERPFKPIIRIGSPLFAVDGRRLGIFLVNYLAAHLIDRLHGASAGRGWLTMLLNGDGFFLDSPWPERQWGFMLGTEETFAKYFPAAWVRVRDTEIGQFEDPAGLFSFDTIYPLKIGQVSSSGSAAFDSPSGPARGYSSFHWKLISLIPRQSLTDAAAAVAHGPLLLGSFVLVLCTGACAWLALAITRKRMLEIQLAAMDRMDTAGVLADGLAHNISNMLVPVLSNSQLLKRRFNPASKEHAKLVTIENAAMRTSRLLNLVRASTHSSRHEMTKTDLTEWLEQVRVSALASIADGTRVDWQLPREAVIVRIDRDAVLACLTELLSNASDALAPGSGELRVAVQTSEVDGAISGIVPPVAPGHYARLTVTDNGCGMDEYTVRRAIEPFASRKPEHQAVGAKPGLGLAFVYRVVADHGGGISIASNLGKGTTVALYLPLG
jgi:signal transduction histidine kinase